MEEGLIMEVARQIASAEATPVTKKCPHALPSVVSISVLCNGEDTLANCPQLRARNSGDMSKVACKHLFRVGCGCPFVLSGKTCASGK